MLKLKLMVLAGAALILGGCSGQEYKLVQTQKPLEEQKISDRSIEYLILPQDRLDIALYKDPQQGAEVAGAASVRRRRGQDQPVAPGRGG